MPILHAALAGVPAFLASLVEFVEALTIVLAVGVASGWRASLAGAGAGVLVLLVLVAGFGRSLADAPERPLQLVVGTLLLLFGARWLRKAALRAVGAIPLHDEDRAFASTRDRLRGQTRAGTFDWGASTTSFNAVVLEGIEVVFIVIALGSTTHAYAPAAFGAAAAFVAITALGVVVHRPLARVPENLLKLIVGVMLAAFGTFWLGEALGVDWPGRDFAILGLVAGYAGVAVLAIAAARGASARA